MGNLVKRLQKVKVENFYKMTSDDCQAILDYTEGKLINSMYYAFLFGYWKGSNAEKAKRRKQNKKIL